MNLPDEGVERRHPLVPPKTILRDSQSLSRTNSSEQTPMSSREVYSVTVPSLLVIHLVFNKGVPACVGSLSVWATAIKSSTSHLFTARLQAWLSFLD